MANFHLYIQRQERQNVNQSDIKKLLQHESLKRKIEGMKELIFSVLEGDQYYNLIMSVIQYVLPSNDHQLIRISLIYFELIDMCHPDGKLREEMILVCNSMRNLLLSPNEYMRGLAMRCVSKFKEAEVIEPLINPIMQNLNHRHSYVRKNALLTLRLLITRFGPEIAPSSVEQVSDQIKIETDQCTKRNGFLFLMHIRPQDALSFVLQQTTDQVRWGEMTKLVIIEFLNLMAQAAINNKSIYLNLITELMKKENLASVLYAGAAAIINLSCDPNNLQCAASALVNIILSHSEQSVKTASIELFGKCIQKSLDSGKSVITDLTRVLSKHSIRVKSLVLDKLLVLIDEKTAPCIMEDLNRELIDFLYSKRYKKDSRYNSYKRTLLTAVHIVMLESEVAANLILPSILKLLSTTAASTSYDLSIVLGNIAIKYKDYRKLICEQAWALRNEIQLSRLFRTLFWIVRVFGEGALFSVAISDIYEMLQPFPLLKVSADDQASPMSSIKEDTEIQYDRSITNKSERLDSIRKTTTKVCEDGTYVTSVENTEGTAKNDKINHLRDLFVQGDVVVIESICICIIQILLSLQKQEMQDKSIEKGLTIILSGLNMVYPSTSGAQSTSLIYICASIALSIYEEKESHLDALKSLLLLKEDYSLYFDDTMGRVFARRSSLKEARSLSSDNTYSINSIIRFSQIKKNFQSNQVLAFSKLREMDQANSALSLTSRKKELCVLQLTGSIDPIFVEAFVFCNEYLIEIKYILKNLTAQDFRKVSIVLSIQGDVSIVNLPQDITLERNSTKHTHATLMLQSSELFVIYGFLVVDPPMKEHSKNITHLPLNPISLSTMVTTKKSWMSMTEFKLNWAEFEWENKILISVANIPMDHLVKLIILHTKMTIIPIKYSQPGSPLSCVPQESNRTSLSDIGFSTSEDVLSIQLPQDISILIETANFVSLNMYCHTIFGECALANISIQQLPSNNLEGIVRIRSETQGIAMNIGNRITDLQKTFRSKLKIANLSGF